MAAVNDTSRTEESSQSTAEEQNNVSGVPQDEPPAAPPTASPAAAPVELPQQQTQPEPEVNDTSPTGESSQSTAEEQNNVSGVPQEDPPAAPPTASPAAAPVELAQQQTRPEPEARCSDEPGGISGAGGMLMVCAGCDKPILDKFLMNVLDRTWHAECVRCHDCRAGLAEKCFSRENKIFCRNDFFRRYGTKCGGCLQGISPSDLVRKARDKVFHLNCFTCMVCRKQLSTGEELYVLDDNKFICKDDYLTGKTGTESLLCSGSEDEEDEDLKSSSHHTGSSPPETNNNSLSGDVMAPLLNCESKTAQDDSEDQGSLDGDPETRDSQTENKSPDDGNSGSKRRGPRTTIKAKQLEILKTAFSQTPKPTRHIREQLAKETGLPMRVIQKPTTAKTAIKGRQLEILKSAFDTSPKPTRQIREQLARETDLPMKVIQVWFQNKRSKERRLKQLTSMGRGPFFGSSRKMRGFPMNLSPGGLEDAPPGFPYFATADGKFEFGYGGPAFHHDFFPGHHPHQGPGGPMPFPGPGGPMDGGIPMHASEFGGMNQDPPPGFLSGPPPPEQQQLLSQRSSPEFISSQLLGTNGFQEPPTSQNEGLVW